MARRRAVCAAQNATACLLCATLIMAVAPAHGQVLRLPPSEPVADQVVVESCVPTGPSDCEAAVAFPPPVGDPEHEYQSLAAREARNGFFQKVSADATWLAGGGVNGLGLSKLSLQTVCALPMPVREWPMLISPGFAAYAVDAPRDDLPDRLYDAYLDLRWFPKLGDRWLLDVNVRPGIYRDFDRDTGSGLRTTAHVAAVWTSTRTSRLALGIAYLDRQDLNWLPIGGILWQPTPDWNLDLLFPEPKIARKFYGFEHYRENVDDWIYIAGEFGDSVWAIQRADGSRDKVAYRDCRLLLGFERRALHQLSGKIEVGYVFGRKLDYASDVGDRQPNSTVLLRGGLSY